MSLLRNITSGLRSLFRKERARQELDEELNGFLDMAAEEKMKQGMSRKDALRAVRLERGSLEVTKEVVRAAGWESFVEALWQDLRFAVRMLRKSPGFTAVAILTLALGIGANTAIFSLVSAVLFRALPYRDPDRLVWATNFVPSQTQDFIFQNVYAAWRDQSHVFENIAAYLPSAGYTLTGAGFRTQGAQVTPSFLDVLSVTPQLGRLIWMYIGDTKWKKDPRFAEVRRKMGVHF